MIWIPTELSSSEQSSSSSSEFSPVSRLKIKVEGLNWHALLFNSEIIKYIFVTYWNTQLNNSNWLIYSIRYHAFSLMSLSESFTRGIWVNKNSKAAKTSPLLTQSSIWQKGGKSGTKSRKAWNKETAHEIFVRWK